MLLSLGREPVKGRHLTSHVKLKFGLLSFGRNV